MPLECSELFSMAPLTRGNHSTEYRIPKDFNLGAGKVRVLQEKLARKYESLASETNTYLEAEGRSVFYDAEGFKGVLAESKEGIKSLRDEIVCLMASIYTMGQHPLPPKEDLERNVSRIIDDCCFVPAALAAAKSMASRQSNSDEAKYKARTEDESRANEVPNARCDCKAEVMSGARYKSTARIKSTSAIRIKVRAKIMSRGAAARARAEAAWDERARAEAKLRVNAKTRTLSDAGPSRQPTAVKKLVRLK